MNRDTLIKKISEQLSGKLIVRGGNYDIEWQIKSSFKDLFDEYDFRYIVVEKDTHANICYIRYRRYYLFALSYTKRKGDNHWFYFNNYTDYYYKDFSCSDQNDGFDLLTKMREIDIMIIDEEKAKAKHEDDMFVYYKQFRAICGDDWVKIFNYIEKHRYDLERRFEKEKMGDNL